MKIADKILFCLLFSALQASAQQPAPAGLAPVMDVSLGYSYMRSTTPLSTGLNLNGAVASLTEGITPRLGIRADLGYSRTANVLGTTHHADVLDYLVGPVFYPRRDQIGKHTSELQSRADLVCRPPPPTSALSPCLSCPTRRSSDLDALVNGAQLERRGREPHRGHNSSLGHQGGPGIFAHRERSRHNAPRRCPGLPRWPGVLSSER